MESVSKAGSMTPSAILSIIGGAVMVAAGILALSVFSGWTLSGMPGWGGGMMGGGGGMMGGGGGMMGGGGGMMGGGFMWAAVGTMSAISIGAGAVSLVGGYSLYKKPETASKWGIAILISGIVGLVGLSGFIIGPIVIIIGGILALAKK